MKSSRMIILPVVVLKSLWDRVVSQVEASNMKSVSYMFALMGEKLLSNPRPLVIEPNRRVTIYSKKKQYDIEFPTVRTSLYVDSDLLERLFEIYQDLCYQQFGEKTTLDVNSLVQTVFYYFCKEHNLPVDENYFDSAYFKANYTFSDKSNFAAFRELTRKMNKTPTIREWRKYRKDVHGPSESYIIQKYGSYNHFKELALNEKAMETDDGI